MYKDLKGRRYVRVNFEIKYDSLLDVNDNSFYKSICYEKDEYDCLKIIKDYDYDGASLDEKEWLSEMVSGVSSDGNKFQRVTGDFSGVIVYDDISLKRTIYLNLNDGSSFYIIFNGLGYFDDEYIYDFISTVILGE